MIQNKVEKKRSYLAICGSCLGWKNASGIRAKHAATWGRMVIYRQLNPFLYPLRGLKNDSYKTHRRSAASVE